MTSPIIRYLAAAILGALTAASAARACEPCPFQLGFEETVERADAVIVGERADVPKAKSKSGLEGEDTIRLRVKRILAGAGISPGDILTVNSWDGMCSYGIVIEDTEQHLVALLKRDGQYDSVELGCGFKTAKISAGAVQIEGRGRTIEDIERYLRITAKR